MSQKPLYAFGDIQFSSLNPWNEEAGNRFLAWFDRLPVEPDAECILLGDLTEKDSNPGNVIRQLEILFQICQKKFKKTYAIVGNHDLKLYKERPQISFIFAKEKKGIEVVDSLSVVTTDNGYKVLFMPYLRLENNALNEYYSNLPEKYYNDSYDLMVGHFDKKSDSSIFMQDGADISKIDTKYTMLGHIHIRWDMDYLGSIWPQKVSEQDTPHPRVIGRLYKQPDGSIVRDDLPIPTFIRYAEVQYPQPLPAQRDRAIMVWTVNNCPNIALAQSVYKNSHIRAVTNLKTEDQRSVDTTSADSSFVVTDFSSAFNQMITEQKIKVSRSAFSIINNLFAGKDI